VKKVRQTNIIYIIGHQRISQITVTNGTEQEYYFTFDGHGSTRALIDFAGAIVQLYAFDAYGNAFGFDPSVALTEFLYSGEQFDAKIGQQYLRARYYDPATGASTDSIHSSEISPTRNLCTNICTLTPTRSTELTQAG
jgi:RHS repeat-associated protein